MPVQTIELTRLDSHTFEHLVNSLARKVIGAGLASFSPGPDAGRDGYFEGTALYPSTSDNWAGVWYIQSKFHAPALSQNPQKWLLGEIKKELIAFSTPKRVLPDNWIVATNIEPSGSLGTGAFDAAKALVKRSQPGLERRFHIWGGKAILDYLADNQTISDYYLDYLTPGHILRKLHRFLEGTGASSQEVIRYLVATRLSDQLYTKLEQAGSTADKKPGIQRLFTDLPFKSKYASGPQLAAETLSISLAAMHKSLATGEGEAWHRWSLDPKRARTWFIKGGPGQGKSTLTQYLSQIHRAAIIDATPEILINSDQRQATKEIKERSLMQGLWPGFARVPIYIELKEYAQWLGQRKDHKSHLVISFLAELFAKELGKEVSVSTLQELFTQSRWFIVFDGLDEVPGDVKDAAAIQIKHFVDDTLIACGSDAMIVCTSRPQGYSGQFGKLEAAEIELVPLSRVQALACARPLLEVDRSASESRIHIEILEAAIHSPAVAEIMTTPLQSHIMAVIVRDGGRPPERKW